MRSLRLVLPALLVVLGLGAGGRVLADPPDVPQRYFLRGLDGKLVRVENPVDGQTWAVWAYRSGAEFDLAISFRDQSGLWSEPGFLGSGDGLSQVQPSLAVDGAGNLYLAYAVRETGQILLTIRPATSGVWSEPQPVTAGGQRRAMPALRVVANRLVLAYRVPNGTEIVDLSLLPTVATPTGIQDGPDPTNRQTDGSGSADPVTDKDHPIGRR